MDALPGIGHACGHNLIAIAGVAVAIAVKSALEKFDISGSVVLLGTPAEEGGSGKAILLERGAYEGMDACLMYIFAHAQNTVMLTIRCSQVPSCSWSSVVCEPQQLPCTSTLDSGVFWAYVRSLSKLRMVEPYKSVGPMPLSRLGRDRTP